MIQANLIGLGADGVTPLGNDDHGIEAGYGAVHLTTIGGTDAGAGNVIADNGERGRGRSSAAPSRSSTCRSSATRSSPTAASGSTCARPLDAGVTENGACKSRRRQPLPAVPALDRGGRRRLSAVAAGTLAAAPATTYRIELFASDGGRPSGNGEAERFLGAVEATTDGAGNAAWLFANPGASLADGMGDSATATALAAGGGDAALHLRARRRLLGADLRRERRRGSRQPDGRFRRRGDLRPSAAPTRSSRAADATRCSPAQATTRSTSPTASPTCWSTAAPGRTRSPPTTQATDPAAIFVGCETRAPGRAGGDAAERTERRPRRHGRTGTATVHKCKGKRATIVGTSTGEKLVGTRKADVIVALGGNDTIKGMGGNDRSAAARARTRQGRRRQRPAARRRRQGPDLRRKGRRPLDGGHGNDTVKGGAGNDVLKGGGGKGDLCDGQAGKKDKLDGKKAGCEKRWRIPERLRSRPEDLASGSDHRLGVVARSTLTGSSLRLRLRGHRR